MVAKVGVIVYSTWGHQNTLSDAVFKGVQKSGAEAIMYQFEETLPQEVLTKMYAAPKPAYPVITPDLLAELDGFIFCFPTRYGRAPAQVSTFFDRTGGLWASGKLIGKFGGIATSAGGQHGGHETTVLTTLPFFAHHGVIFVPIGYAKSEISNEESIVGGSPWGASVVAGGKGTLPVLDSDKVVAEYQGENFGTIVNTFLKGKNAA
ncbi:flavoprotein-like protein [Mrakia frigida]|uniref:flavoprotein-like protein n=1 Tax=Mrakia frigida TaxID=29902 RepID=UPI003FCC03B0